MWHRVPLVAWAAACIFAATRVPQTFNLVTNAVDVDPAENPRYLALSRANALGAFRDGSIAAISWVGVLSAPVDATVLLTQYPLLSHVTHNDTLWTWNQTRQKCKRPSPAKVVSVGAVAHAAHDVVVFPAWCRQPQPRDAPASLRAPWLAWPKGSSDAAAKRGLAVGDGIGIPLALAVFAKVMRPSLVVLPIVAAVATAVVSLAILGAVAAQTPISPLAINVQCAFAFSLAIDYTMLAAANACGFRTVRVSSALLVGTTVTLLIAPSQSIRAMGYAALIAVVVAVLANQTLIRFLLPSRPDDDDDLLLNPADPEPVVARRPGLVVSAMLFATVVSAWQCARLEFCGGRMCMAPISAVLKDLQALGEEPAGATVLLGSGDTLQSVSACLGPIRRSYTVGTGLFADVRSPPEMTPDFIRWARRANGCLSRRSTLIANGLDELDLMRGTVDRAGYIAAAVLLIVGGVISAAYAAPIISLKAMGAVVGTFAIALAATSVITGGSVCWIVPMVCFPISVGLGMDFHVFFLDGIKTRDRCGILNAVQSTRKIITGAGIILAVAFLGLSVVPVLLVRQMSVFLATTAIVDTFVMRPFVVPAAMILLGKRNWLYSPGSRSR